MGKKAEDQIISQAGVIPYRIRSDGSLQVLLITSRVGAWIVPKGKIDEGHTAHEAARIEALEEAGVVGIGGSPEGEPLGHYEYEKLGSKHRVDLYAMPVLRVLEDWPDRDHRRREWMSIDEAIRRVEYPDLRDVLERMERFDRSSGAA